VSTSAKKSVAIYGGGIAGAVLANRLSRDFNVVLVDPHDYFEVPMAAPRKPCAAGLRRSSNRSVCAGNAFRPA
jgi:2-polyprenyl-6-methoxyphenol hydroxylase-like FAD-dependent oxidoreductase